MQNEVFERSRIGSSGRLVYKHLLLAQMVIERPTLLFVKSGHNFFRKGGREWIVKAGQAAALEAGQVFNVEHRPSVRGIYESCWLACEPIVLMDDGPAISGNAMLPSIDSLMVIEDPEPAFMEAFEHARHGIMETEHVPESIAQHRITELLLWLRTYGGHFGNPHPPTIAHAVRVLLSAAPNEPWTTPGISRQLGMSEATLRRRLAHEQQSVTQILGDVRMSRAFSLLMSTNHSLTEIANEVGYNSPSRFSMRFRRIFGQCPAVIRRNRDAFPQPVVNNARAADEGNEFLCQTVSQLKTALRAVDSISNSEKKMSK